MEIPLEGKYVCKLNGQLVIYEASTQSICCAVQCAIVDTGYTFKHTLVLVKADGTIQIKTVDTLKAVFGWDGVDPYWLMDKSEDGGPLRLVEFEIVGGPATNDKGGKYFKSQWLNPLGRGVKAPAPADRRSVLEKYGTKFQALADVSAKPGKLLTVSAPKPPPVPQPPPSLLAPSTMEEAWAALNEAQVGNSAAAIEKTWFDTIARLFPHRTNMNLKPHEWGKVKSEFTDQIPM